MMIKQVIQQIEPSIKKVDFNWVGNSNVKELLDVISSIIADEYIEIAKRNRDVFSNEK